MLGVVQSPAMSYGYVPPASPPVAPPPPSGYPAANAQPISSKKLAWIVVSVVLAVVLLAALFVGLIVSVVFGAMKSTEPYQHAVQVATHDPRVLARLGEPVKPGWLPAGSISVAGDSGSADLTIALEGTAHKGKLYVVAKKSEGEWTYQKLVLRVEDRGERIDLLQPADALPQER